MAGIGAISPAHYCSHISLQALPPHPLLPNPLLTRGVELAQTYINPRSCFWATLTKSAIMHTSFHIYAKSTHPTHISTVFQALCSLGRSGWILPRIHNLVLIISSCWALEHRAFSSRTTATRANGSLCYQEANPSQSSRILPHHRSRGKPSSATIGGWNSLTLQGRREHHQHCNCLPLMLLGGHPSTKEHLTPPKA